MQFKSDAHRKWWFHEGRHMDPSEYENDQDYHDAFGDNAEFDPNFEQNQDRDFEYSEYLDQAESEGWTDQDWKDQITFDRQYEAAEIERERVENMNFQLKLLQEREEKKRNSFSFKIKSFFGLG